MNRVCVVFQSWRVPFVRLLSRGLYVAAVSSVEINAASTFIYRGSIHRRHLHRRH